MVATFFFQRTTAFTLFLIVPSLQISCFRKTKEKQYAKYDLNKRIAARLIWQLVIHSGVIFAYIISRRDGENNGFPCRRFPPSLPPRAPLTFPSRLKPPFPSLSNTCHAGYIYQWIARPTHGSVCNHCERMMDGFRWLDFPSWLFVDWGRSGGVCSPCRPDESGMGRLALTHDVSH